MINNLFQIFLYDILLQNKYGRTPLQTAALYLRVESVDFLLAHKADMNIIDDDGETTIHIVADSEFISYDDCNKERAIKILQALLNHGANINVQNDRKGHIPLHHALNSVPLKLIKFLLQNGADINMKTYDDKGSAGKRMQC